MNKEFMIRYKEILEKQLNKGLDILSSLNVADENYKDVVVNINNANNIAIQLDAEIKKLDEEANKEKIEETVSEE